MTKVHNPKPKKAKAAPKHVDDVETITLVQSPDGSYEDKPIRGRPRAVTAEWQELICDEIANGKSLYEICAEYKPHGLADYRNIMHTLRKDEFFRQQYTRARVEQQEALAEQTIAVAKGIGEYANMETNDRRLLIDTIKWSAGKLKPKVYGERIDVAVDETINLKVQLEKKLNLDALDDESLEKLQSSLSNLKIAQQKQEDA